MKQHTLDMIRQLLVVLVVIATLAVNALSNLLPFNDLTTGEISARFDVLFVPAGYVFSIWSLIYIGLIAFAIYQAVPANQSRFRRIGLWVMISGIANMAWLFLWHYLLFGYTLIAMGLLLLSLLFIYSQVQEGSHSFKSLEQWTVQIPFRIYLGWIIVATLANVTVVMEASGWSGFGFPDSFWAISLLILATAFGWWFARYQNDGIVPLVLVWAFIGIAVKQQGVVEGVSWVAVILCLGAIVTGFWRENRTVSKDSRQ
jgi:hypothetical protein